MLINNAGIMRIENILDQPDDLADVEATISTNLLGPIRLTAALLPHRRAAESGQYDQVFSALNHD